MTRLPTTPRAVLFRFVGATSLVAVAAITFGNCALAMRARIPTAAESLFARTVLGEETGDVFRYLRTSRPELAMLSGATVVTLPDASLDRVRRDAQFARSSLLALDDIDVVALPEDDYVSWLTLRWDMEWQSGWPAYAWTDLRDILPGQSALDVAAEVLRDQRITSPADAQRFLQLVTSLDTLVNNLRRAFVDRAAHGVRLPRYVLPRVVGHLRSFVAPPAVSPLGLPSDFLVQPDTLWQVLLEREVRDAIGEHVNLALDALASYLEGAYQAEAPVAIGLYQYPGGLAHYAALLRFHSTLDITPGDAHAIGLREVARLAALAAESRDQANLPVNRDSLRSVLRSDPRFQPADSQSILELIGSLYQEAYGRLESAFGPGPSSPLSLAVTPRDEEAYRPLAAYLAPSVPHPAAQYRISIDRLQRGLFIELPALVHEDLMPGEHHQLGRQRENVELPAFRRLSTHDGFVRGWQVYVLSAADSLSGLSTPERRFGSRLRELASACGLVVDTGINALGWTREQSLAFLRDYLPDDDEDLEREFIVQAVESPGQLSAGTLGARELRGLRQWVERELGPRFDLAKFHGELLRVGSVPLPVLGTHLERWIWEQSQPADTAGIAPAARGDTAHGPPAGD